MASFYEYSAFTPVEVSEPTGTGRDFFESPRGWSVVKHNILTRYFDAWLPIMSQTWIVNKIIYIDGFAGTGRYEDGTDGSPLMVYKRTVEHKLRPNFRRPIMMYFIEKDKTRAATLRNSLDAVKFEYTHNQTYGPSVQEVSYEVMEGTFAEKIEEILNEIEHEYKTAILAFVDPFGFNGATTPMELMRKLIGRSRYAPTELFFNLMDGFANRFFKVDSRAAAINKLLGVDSAERWRESVCAQNLSPAQRLEKFIDIYWRNLTKEHGEPELNFYRLKFSIRNARNRHIYHLLFVTGHLSGLACMKSAMWKETQEVERLQYSEFSVNTIGNFNMLENRHRRAEMSELIKLKIMEKFYGERNVTGHRIEEYIVVETDYPFNVKNELKKILKNFVAQPDRAFDKIKFSFT